MPRLKGAARYSYRLRALLRDEYPQADPTLVTALIDRLSNLETFARQQICRLSTNDTEQYVLDFVEIGHQKMDLTNLPAYCDQHEVIHNYPSGAFAQAMLTEHKAILELAAALNPTGELSPPVKDRIISRPLGIKDAALKAHRYDKILLKEIKAIKRREALHDFFFELSLEDQLEFQLCGRKNSYPTAQAAETMRATIIATSPEDATLKVYRCPRCDAYHMGHGAYQRDYTTMTPTMIEHLALVHWRHGTAHVREFAITRGYLDEFRISRAEMLEFREQNTLTGRSERAF